MMLSEQLRQSAHPLNAIGASTVVGGGTDYIAVLGDVVLPATNGNSRQATDMVILLATLTALTALAGTQLLRRA